MMRLIAAWLTLNVYVLIALVIWTTDWRKERAENHDDLVARLALFRQRLAHPEGGDDTTGELDNE